MSSNDQTITLTLLAKDLASGNVGGFIGKLDTLAKRGGLVGSMAQGVGIQMGMMLNPIGLVTRGIGELTNFLGDSLTKAGEEQVGIQRLGTALKDNVPAWDGNTSSVERLIAARQSLAFSDGEQRDVLSQLITRTKDITKAQDLERQSMDLSRAKNISLTDASLILGKVYGGNVGILSRYGIQVTKGATATQALAEIQKATAGQAETYASTQKGAQDKLAIAFENLQENVGGFMQGPATDFVNFLSDLVGGAPPATGVIGDLTDSYWKLADAKKHAADAPSGTPVVGDKSWLGLLGMNEHLNDFYALIGDPMLQQGQRLFQEFGSTLFQNQQQAEDLAHAMGDAGLSFDEMRQKAQATAAGIANSGTYVQRYGAAWEKSGTSAVTAATLTAGAADAVVQSAADIAKAEADTAKLIEKNMAAANASIASLAPTSKKTLQSMKQDAKSLLNDFIWNMNHAQAFDKAAAKLEMDMSNAQLQRGLERGDALAQATMAKLISSLATLRGQAISAGDAMAWVLGMGPMPGLGVEWLTGPRGHHTSGGGINRKTRAAGGPTPTGIFTVGENGPETLVVGPGYAGIDPRRSGGGVHLHFHSTFPPTEAQLRQIAEQVGPAITKWQTGR